MSLAAGQACLLLRVLTHDDRPRVGGLGTAAFLGADKSACPVGQAFELSTVKIDVRLHHLHRFGSLRVRL